MNFILDALYKSPRPIVLVGEVTRTQAKIFVAHRGRFNKELKVLGKYDTIRKKLIVDTDTKYSAFVITINGLEQNRKYTIPIQVNDFVIDVEFKTQSNESNPTTFLVGSCNLHTIKPIKNPEAAFDTINKLREKHSVDFMFHLGDQIYADIPSPLFNPTLNYYCEKYFSAWSDCKSANSVLSKMSNYMTLDDHEIINNYRNRSDREKYENGLLAYDIFQLSHSPRKENQTHYSFYHNNIPFFVLDVRTTRNERNNQMICDKQEHDLYEWLIQHKDTKSFKFISTAVPFLVDMENTEHDKWCTGRFSGQRNRIIEFITTNEIHNVIFLSGDVHCSLVTTGNFESKITNKVIQIHEITSSPINQIQIANINSFIRNHTIDNQNIKGRVSTHNYYDKHSNVALIKVYDDCLHFQYFRTETSDKVKSGSIDLRV